MTRRARLETSIEAIARENTSIAATASDKLSGRLEFTTNYGDGAFETRTTASRSSKGLCGIQQADLKASWAGNSKRDFSSHMDASWSSQRQVMPGDCIPLGLTCTPVRFP